MRIKKNSKDTYVAGDTSIRDAIKLKSFLTYKHLLDIHHIKKDSEIDLVGSEKIQDDSSILRTNGRNNNSN